MDTPQIILGTRLDWQDFDSMRSGGTYHLLSAPKFIHWKRMPVWQWEEIAWMVKATHGKGSDNTAT
jgi:hypothetical protein